MDFLFKKLVSVYSVLFLCMHYKKIAWILNNVSLLIAFPFPTVSPKVTQRMMSIIRQSSKVVTAKCACHQELQTFLGLNGLLGQPALDSAEPVFKIGPAFVGTDLWYLLQSM